MVRGVSRGLTSASTTVSGRVIHIKFSADNFFKAKELISVKTLPNGESLFLPLTVSPITKNDEKFKFKNQVVPVF
jgi:hypothetical protein